MIKGDLFTLRHLCLLYNIDMEKFNIYLSEKDFRDISKDSYAQCNRLYGFKIVPTDSIKTRIEIL